MLDSVQGLWATPVRAGPVLIGVVSFALINGMRRWFRIKYTPSYFVAFPISLLNPDVARFTGMGPFEPPETEAEKQDLKTRFIAKAVIAAIITIIAIPIFLGFLAAFYMEPPEFALSLAVILAWQAYSAFQSVMDNAHYGRRPIRSTSFLSMFYLFYLVGLGGFMHRGFVFTRPYVLAGDWSELAESMWDALFLLVFAGIIVGVVGSLIAHFIAERDVF